MYSDTSRVTFLPKSPVTNVQSITPPSGIGYTNANDGQIPGSGKMGFMSSMALLLLVAVGMGSVGVFLYQKYYERQRYEIIQTIKQNGKKIVPEFITKADILNRRLKYIKTLLDQHPFVTPVMADLEQHTLPDIQFDSFKLEENKNTDFNSIQSSDSFKIEINGKARSYEVIAQQSDEFAKSEYIKTHFFSDFKNEKEKNNIGFLLTIEIPKAVMFAFPKISAALPEQQVLQTNNLLPVVEAIQNPDVGIYTDNGLPKELTTSDNVFVTKPVLPNSSKTTTTTTTTTGSGGSTTTSSNPSTTTRTQTPNSYSSGSGNPSSGTITPGDTTTGSVGYDKKKTTTVGSGSSNDINKNSFKP